MKNIYLLGSLNCDLTIKAPYMPESGETLAGSEFMMTAGGKGANQAYACASLGGKVYMAGAVGSDAFGDMLLNNLSKVGADVSCVKKSSRSTGVAMITVVGGDNRIILSEGANGDVNESDVDTLLSTATQGDIFMAQLENPLPVVEYALKKAKEKGLFTLLNPAPAKAEARALVKYSDLITPNEKELRLMSEKQTFKEGCEELLRLGAGAVLVTLGGEGSKYVSKQENFAVASVNVGKVIDTTAAGDTYCGALAVMLAEGKSMKQAAEFASVCSGITVTRRGAQVAIPTRAEAEEVWRR